MSSFTTIFKGASVLNAAQTADRACSAPGGRADSTKDVRRCVPAAETLRTAIGSPRMPVACARYEAITAPVRGQLGTAEFAAAWAEGQAKTLEQAIAYALNIAFDSHSRTTITQ